MSKLILSGSKYKKYSEYKESGSKWLDEIPDHWKVTSLKHVLSTPITDGPHLTPNKLDKGIPFISAEAISQGYINFDKKWGYISKENDELFSQKYRPQRHDVYMIKSGATTGVTAIVETDKQFNIWSPLAVMRCKNIYNPYFLLNYLRSDSFQKSVQLSWTFGTQQNIGMNTLENLTVCYPPIGEQTQIANFLDHETAKIDTLIDKQQQLIKLLKEKRQAVISYAVTKGLNPEAPMKNSGVEWLGEVPEHWDVSVLKYHVDTINGFGFSSSDFIDDGVPFIRAGNIKNKTITKPSIFLPSKVVEKYKRVKLKSGDVVISMVGSDPKILESAVGQIGIVPNQFEGAVPNQNIVILREKNSCLMKKYLFYVLCSNGYRNHLNVFSHKLANQSIISSSLIVNGKFSFPLIQEQIKIIKYLDEKLMVYKLAIEQSEKSIVLMQERRTALISATVTGKIDVRYWQLPSELQ